LSVAFERTDGTAIFVNVFFPATPPASSSSDSSDSSDSDRENFVALVFEDVSFEVARVLVVVDDLLCDFLNVFGMMGDDNLTVYDKGIPPNSTPLWFENLEVRLRAVTRLTT
jgi:hypothetical protein